jgi:hypothetical protein
MNSVELWRRGRPAERAVNIIIVVQLLVYGVKITHGNVLVSLL